MRAIQMALFILVFNIAMSFVVEANIFGSANIYFENTISGKDYSSELQNISITNEQETNIKSYYTAKDILSILSFNWIRGLFPQSLRTSFLDYIITSLNTILSLLIGVALIELIRGRWGILGGGS